MSVPRTPCGMSGRCRRMVCCRGHERAAGGASLHQGEGALAVQRSGAATGMFHRIVIGVNYRNNYCS